MAKITVKAVTRLQKFLAAIAGDGAAPNPITDKEKLLHNIAENVNNGGDSGGGGVLVVHDVEGTLDKTWQEIHDAMLSGGAVIQVSETDVNTVESVNLGKGAMYYVNTSDGHSYIASSASDYPVVMGSGNI